MSLRPLVSSASIKGLLQAFSIYGPKRVVLDVKSLVTNSEALLVRSAPLATALSERLICLADNHFCFFMVFVVELPDLFSERSALLKTRRETRRRGRRGRRPNVHCARLAWFHTDRDYQSDHTSSC